MSQEGCCCLEEIRSVEDLERLRPEWSALWQADPRATPFQSPEWLLPWWQAVGEGELSGLAIRDRAGRLIGLLPLYVYMQPEGGRRDRLLLGAGTSDYLGGLFAANSAVPAGEIARVALRWAMAADRSRWDRTILHQLRQDSLLLAAAEQLEAPRSDAEPCSVLQTDPSARPAKLRLNLGRYRRRAQAEGELCVRTAATAREAGEALETLILLHARRWQERGEEGVLATPAVQRHHRAAVPLLQAAGLLRMTTLTLAGRPLAVLYSLLDPPGRLPAAERRWYGYLIGIESDRGELSPGTLLLGAVLEIAAHEGIATFDMLRGGEQYKRFWGACSEPTYALQTAEEAPGTTVQ